MTADLRFSVRGKRVTVVGAARSGVAAAELLVRRGASVTLTDAQARTLGHLEAHIAKRPQGRVDRAACP